MKNNKVRNIIHYSHHFKTSTAVREHEDVVLGLLLPIVALGQEPVLLVSLTTHPVVIIVAVCTVCPRPHTHPHLNLLCEGVLHQELQATWKIVSIIHCTAQCLFRNTISDATTTNLLCSEPQ